VELAETCTAEQTALVLRYLGEAERFSATEWVMLLEAFTTLGASSVFLYVARSFPLTADFYITRLFQPETRRYDRIVVLTESGRAVRPSPRRGQHLVGG
jgi:hypothetical protein